MFILYVYLKIYLKLRKLYLNLIKALLMLTLEIDSVCLQ